MKEVIKKLFLIGLCFGILLTVGDSSKNKKCVSVEESFLNPPLNSCYLKSVNLCEGSCATGIIIRDKCIQQNGYNCVVRPGLILVEGHIKGCSYGALGCICDSGAPWQSWNAVAPGLTCD